MSHFVGLLKSDLVNMGKNNCLASNTDLKVSENHYFDVKTNMNHGHLKVRPNILPTQIRVELSQLNMGQVNQQVIIIDPSKII